MAAVEDVVRRARQAGVALTGPDGRLKAMTKTVVEAAIEEEVADPLGYDNALHRGPESAQLPER